MTHFECNDRCHRLLFTRRRENPRRVTVTSTFVDSNEMFIDYDGTVRDNLRWFPCCFETFRKIVQKEARERERERNSEDQRTKGHSHRCTRIIDIDEEQFQ
jgi:hypothetical protein